ncbi:MAG: FixH family protein [Gemmatimonadota bacterium]
MKADLRWPVGITVLLAVFVVANLLVMRIAGTDPSFAIEPDYYQKAVAFDSTMALERQSAALRWTVTSAIVRDSSGATLTVTLTDALGQPVTGASVTASARFNARANDVLSAALREAGPGRYLAPLDVRHAGQWEVRVDATRGPQRFLASTRTEAPASR